MDTARMDVVPDGDEQFRQFQADHLARQTVAVERTARHAGTIEMLIVLGLILAVVAGLIVLLRP